MVELLVLMKIGTSVSIPMTVLGGLQSACCSLDDDAVQSFNTDDGIRRATILIPLGTL